MEPMDGRYVIQSDLTLYFHNLSPFYPNFKVHCFAISWNLFLQNFDRENNRYKIIKHYKYFLIILLFLYSLANFIIIVFVIYLVNNLVYIIIDLILLLTISVKHFLDNIYFENFYNNLCYYIYCTMYNVIYIYIL